MQTMTCIQRLVVLSCSVPEGGCAVLEPQVMYRVNGDERRRGMNTPLLRYSRAPIERDGVWCSGKEDGVHIYESERWRYIKDFHKLLK